MATLTVDRLHTRYVVDRPTTADRLDACLRRVVAEELDRALPEAVSPAAHVCLPRLTVAVSLDPGSGTVSAARLWAAEIVAALQGALRDGTGVVVYSRTLDALVDLVVSAGRGDTRRAWAWRQVGLAGTDPTRPGELVAVALTGQPALVPAALTAAAALGPVPLTTLGWVAVARAVQNLAADPQVPPPRVITDGGSGTTPCPADDTAARPLDAALVHAILASPVARQLPGADLAPSERRALARLALLCAAPSFARSAPMIEAVAGALAARSADPPPGVGTGRQPDPTAAGTPATPRAAAEHESASAPDRPASIADPAVDGDRFAGGEADPLDAGQFARPAISSAVGGALFLVQVVTVLDLVTETSSPNTPLAGRPFPWTLAALAVRLTDATAEDPVIRVLAGSLADPLGIRPADPPTEAEGAALAALTRRIETWLRTRLQLDAGDDLTWLWQRRAEIVTQPGWIEAVFALDDVDTRVRVAGLDLDPGFVWWLGAVVRFRYV